MTPAQVARALRARQVVTYSYVDGGANFSFRFPSTWARSDILKDVRKQDPRYTYWSHRDLNSKENAAFKEPI